ATVRIFAHARFGVIICVGLFWCSQAIAGGRAQVSFKTSVTGGTIVRNDGSSMSIKELDTNRLIEFFFNMTGEVRVKGGDDAGKTKVIVDEKPATPDEP